MKQIALSLEGTVIFDENRDYFINQRNLTFLFIGSGPGPEITALMDVLKINSGIGLISKCSVHGNNIYFDLNF